MLNVLFVRIIQDLEEVFRIYGPSKESQDNVYRAVLWIVKH